MKIINKLPHSPYFICIKGLNHKNDEELLELLGLHKCKEIEIPKDFEDENCIYISNDTSWIHIMDNYYYTFWQSDALSVRIEELGEKYEIFTFSVGDSDLSFDFKYFKNGTKIREYIVTSPNYNDEVIEVNNGTPLFGETEGLKKKDQFDRIIYIADSLGIILPEKEEEIRCYKIPNAFSVAIY